MMAELTIMAAELSEEHPDRSVIEKFVELWPLCLANAFDRAKASFKNDGHDLPGDLNLAAGCILLRKGPQGWHIDHCILDGVFAKGGIVFPLTDGGRATLIDTRSSMEKDEHGKELTAVLDRRSVLEKFVHAVENADNKHPVIPTCAFGALGAMLHFDDIQHKAIASTALTAHRHTYCIGDASCTIGPVLHAGPGHVDQHGIVQEGCSADFVGFVSFFSGQSEPDEDQSFHAAFVAEHFHSAALAVTLLTSGANQFDMVGHLDPTSKTEFLMPGTGENTSISRVWKKVIDGGIEQQIASIALFKCAITENTALLDAAKVQTVLAGYLSHLTPDETGCIQEQLAKQPPRQEEPMDDDGSDSLEESDSDSSSSGDNGGAVAATVHKAVKSKPRRRKIKPIKSTGTAVAGSAGCSADSDAKPVGSKPSPAVATMQTDATKRELALLARVPRAIDRLTVLQHRLLSLPLQASLDDARRLTTEMAQHIGALIPIFEGVASTKAITTATAAVKQDFDGWNREAKSSTLRRASFSESQCAFCGESLSTTVGHDADSLGCCRCGGTYCPSCSSSFAVGTLSRTTSHDVGDQRPVCEPCVLQMQILGPHIQRRQQPELPTFRIPDETAVCEAWKSLRVLMSKRPQSKDGRLAEPTFLNELAGMEVIAFTKTVLVHIKHTVKVMGLCAIQMMTCNAYHHLLVDDSDEQEWELNQSILPFSPFDNWLLSVFDILSKIGYFPSIVPVYAPGNKKGNYLVFTGTPIPAQPLGPYCGRVVPRSHTLDDDHFMQKNLYSLDLVKPLNTWGGPEHGLTIRPFDNQAGITSGSPALLANHSSAAPELQFAEMIVGGYHFVNEHGKQVCRIRAELIATKHGSKNAVANTELTYHYQSFGDEFDAESAATPVSHRGLGGFDGGDSEDIDAPAPAVAAASKAPMANKRAVPAGADANSTSAKKPKSSLPAAAAAGRR